MAEHEGCRLQIGGSDQWGNITAGIDLTRKRLGVAAHGLTWPLMTRADGAKFGKTADGAVWLAADRTSPYQFFQYWMQVDDSDVGRFCRQLTLLDLATCAEIEAEHRLEPHKRSGQRRLAREITSLVHGAAAADAAEAATDLLFGQPIDDADPAAFAVLASEIPTTRLQPERLAEGISVMDLLAETGVAKSKGEVRKNPDGFSINQQRIALDQVVAASDLVSDGYLLIRKGKRTYHLVVVEVAAE